MLAKFYTSFIKWVKRIVMFILVVVALIVYSPLLTTDKATYEALRLLQKSYSDLYIGGNSLCYAVVMQAAKDTSYDIIDSYQNTKIINSKSYQIEINAIKDWNSINYSGKDKLLYKISTIMETYNYAPAKAATDLSKLTTGKIFNTRVTYKALCYNIRFDNSMIYIVFLLLSTLSIIGGYYVLYLLDFSDGCDENDHLYEEEDYEDDYVTNIVTEDYDKNEFEESIKNRRMRSK